MIELDARQTDRYAIACDLTSGFVDLQVGDAQAAWLYGVTLHPAQHGARPGHQFARRKRLGDGVVCAQFQDDAVLLTRLTSRTTVTIPCSMMTIHALETIGIDPDIRNGRPHIIGTNVTVADVAIARLYHGLDAEDIADWYGLDLHQAFAALAYHYQHKPAIDEQVRLQIRRAEALKEQRVGAGDSLLSR